MTPTIAKKQLAWVNCIKAIAIIAVLIDHTYGLAYANAYIAQGSYFSVTLFVLISGYSTYLSAKNKKINEIDSSFKTTLKKLTPLLSQYILATLIVGIYTSKSFILLSFWDNIIYFNAQSPYYFVLFFLQLKLITPLLLKLLKISNKYKFEVLFDIASLFTLFIIASICINHTYILPVHGGGMFLFGGTYLPVYYLGMLLNKYNLLEKIPHKAKCITLLPLALLWLTWIYLLANSKLKFDIALQQYFGYGFNPPSANFIIYALITMFLFSFAFSLLEQSKLKLFALIAKAFDYIGKHSLYIFLYHYLVLTIFRDNMELSLLTIRLIVFPCMVLVPCFMADLVRFIKSKCDILAG